MIKSSPTRTGIRPFTWSFPPFPSPCWPVSPSGLRSPPDWPTVAPRSSPHSDFLNGQSLPSALKFMISILINWIYYKDFKVYMISFSSSAKCLWNIIWKAQSNSLVVILSFHIYLRLRTFSEIDILYFNLRISFGKDIKIHSLNANHNYLVQPICLFCKGW